MEMNLKFPHVQKDQIGNHSQIPLETPLVNHTRIDSTDQPPVYNSSFFSRTTSSISSNVKAENVGVISQE